MFSSRHVLAIVCGLGMGVMASLFLFSNILADYSDDGVVGLPANINGNQVLNISLKLYKNYFPLLFFRIQILLNFMTRMPISQFTMHFLAHF
jgi:hypothetical protein